jgi:hypothetical protein
VYTVRLRLAAVFVLHRVIDLDTILFARLHCSAESIKLFYAHLLIANMYHLEDKVYFAVGSMLIVTLAC